MELESELRGEIEKWTLRIEEEIKSAKLKDTKDEHLMKNIKAYIEDSRYFFEKEDLIRSFEAIIWAWSWLEILRELKIFK
jgi:hypothetical protein